MNEKNTNNFESYDIESLASMIHNGREKSKEINNNIKLMEFTLKQKMDKENQIVYPSDMFEIKQVFEEGGYDYNKLHALRELLPKSEIAEFYTPSKPKEGMEPEKYDGRKLRSLGKFGDSVQTVLDEARLPKKFKWILITPK